MNQYRPPSYFAEKVGFSTRWVTEKARHGEIPGTVKAGCHYRINVHKFWQWWHAQEVKKWHPSTTKEKTIKRTAPNNRNDGSRLRQILGMDN